VWHENQPMTVLEAMAAGAPVVATDLGGLPELVRPGLDGLIVPAGDPGALAAALRTMLDDPRAAAEMGRAGQARMTASFSAEHHQAGLRRLYALAAERAGSSSTSLRFAG
jgi:glycosyltransferase involved in cell wall biosynthesis